MATQRQPLVDIPPSYERGRHLAQHIFMATLAAVDVRRAMLSKIQFADGTLKVEAETVPIAKPPRIVAFGKAAARMTTALNEILGGKVEAGVVVTPAEPVHQLPGFQYFCGGHPYPTQGSLDGAAAALKLVSSLSRDDLVIFLVSGGGSAMFEKPLDPSITLADLAEFNRVLVTGVLPIEEINILRKHLSSVKGGRLAAAAFPARQLTVYISDVPEQFPSMVASGPTRPDESTCTESYELAQKYDLLGRFPPRIRKHFEQRTLEETPKPGDKRFSNSNYFCLLSNRDAVETARILAAEVGFEAAVDSGVWDVDYQQVADRSLGSLEQAARANPGKPVCLVMGGEITCPVTGHGVGGRNLSFALYAASKIEGRKQVVLSGATDGRDGNSPSCGAVADGHTAPRARVLGLDPAKYLAESDAYHFFRTLGDTIETGFTDNNVRDLRLLMSFE